MFTEERKGVENRATKIQEISYSDMEGGLNLKNQTLLAPTKKPLNLSIQGLFDVAVWLHDLDSNQGPSD